MARSDEGKRMGMHAGSNGDLRSNILWSFGSFYLKLVSPMCWNFPAALHSGPPDFPSWLCSSTRCRSFTAFLL
ncbi:hypothetical protein ACE6H2_019910 [Prunus campanulata]